MEAPGESGAGLLGAPSPTSFAPGHLEREKLVKLEGQPGGAGAGGPQNWVCPGARRGRGLGKVPSPWPPAQVWRLPPGQRRTRCTMCLMPAGHEQVGLSSPVAP